MSKGTREVVEEQSKIEAKSALEEVLHRGAQEMLMKAVEAEVAEYIDRHAHLRGPDGGPGEHAINDFSRPQALGSAS